MGLRAGRWGQETGGGACKPYWEGAPEQGSLCAKVGFMVLVEPEEGGWLCWFHSWTGVQWLLFMRIY